jgi:hypothetical protein
MTRPEHGPGTDERVDVSTDAVAGLLARTTAASGVPLVVADPVALRRIAAIVRPGGGA